MPVTDERSARVLLVDGTGTLEDRFGTALANAGFGVTTVGSASDCLRRVSDGDVDGIVSRYDLPDLDGIRLLRSVRLSFPLLPFVLVPDDG